MKIQAPNLNYLWTSMIIEELIRNGVDYFCIAPGSRSAPLATAAASNSKAKVKVHFDERGLAFHALGYARATGKPAVVITTSGTAVGNLLPAVIEASEDQVPMILLTADRPPELRETRSNQAIDQNKIFGSYTRWFFEMPCPDSKIQPEFVLTTIDQAVSRAVGVDAGPVHLNCCFREPLAPDAEAGAPFELPARLSSYWDSGLPMTQRLGGIPSLPAPELQDLATRLSHTEKGLLVVGALKFQSQMAAVQRLATHLGWPWVADITSGLKSADTLSLTSYDSILLSKEKWTELKPSAIVHVGGRLTSKRLIQFLEQSRPEFYCQIDSHSVRQDPNHQVTHRIQADISDLSYRLISLISIGQDSHWTQLWKDTHQKVGQKVLAETRNLEILAEPKLAQMIAENIPPSHGLFLASSMPIRDMDIFGALKHSIQVGANRGASGIDGTLASACGFAMGLQRPVTLLIGDLALLHDLNSLAMLRESPFPVTIVAINNDGGGIFSFLPIAQHQQVFEKLYGTPHGLGFEAAQDLFKISYRQPKKPSEFLESYQAALRSDRSSLIEVKTERVENFKIHQKLNQTINHGGPQ